MARNRWLVATLALALGSMGTGCSGRSGKASKPQQAPEILAQPADVAVNVGQPASFSVTASGTAPLSYQWRRNGAEIPGATGGVYTVASAGIADRGSTYSVVVSNGAGSAVSREAALTVAQSLGMAVVPRNFPDFTLSDWHDACELSAGLARHGVMICQWQNDAIDSLKFFTDSCRDFGLLPMLGLSPTTLDRDRRELEIPDSVRAAAGDSISFSNPVIREAFKSAAKELAGLRPVHLCLATEINFLIVDLPEFASFVTLYKETREEVRRISPETKVFVSFNWEFMLAIDEALGEPGIHREIIDAFRPSLDAIGLTTYPSPEFDGPADLPEDYFTLYVEQADEVVFMEAGWPTAGSGTEQEQSDFIDRIPQLTRGINMSVFAWALLHDVALDVFDDDLNTVGLLTRSGDAKTGLARFENLGAELNGPTTHAAAGLRPSAEARPGRPAPVRLDQPPPADADRIPGRRLSW